jgi:hypothetical protein
VRARLANADLVMVVVVVGWLVAVAG